jgi:hypothetical protein
MQACRKGAHGPHVKILPIHGTGGWCRYMSWPLRLALMLASFSASASCCIVWDTSASQPSRWRRKGLAQARGAAGAGAGAGAGPGTAAGGAMAAAAAGDGAAAGVWVAVRAGGGAGSALQLTAGGPTGGVAWESVAARRRRWGRPGVSDGSIGSVDGGARRCLFLAEPPAVTGASIAPATASVGVGGTGARRCSSAVTRARDRCMHMMASCGRSEGIAQANANKQHR